MAALEWLKAFDFSMNIRTHPATRAFSLVEVVLALGIVSFCLISIIGLLPVGLNVIKNANDESAAGIALTQLSSAIRNATPNGAPGNYVASGAFSNISWKDGTPDQGRSMVLSLDGKPSTLANGRFVVRVQVVAPTAAGLPGKALISIAWPAVAEWSTSSNAWTRSDGTISSGIIFLPKL